MKRNVAIALALTCAVVVTGCQRFSGSRNYAAPLPATPTTPVGQGDLQPLDPLAPAPGTVDTGVPGTDVAAAPVVAPAGALEIGRSDMAGGWKIASAGDNCMAFMALTTWSGGYRANTRGCSSPALSSISAWDLNDKQVVLKDGSGGVVAQLYATSAEQFNGQTSTGVPISLYR
ncbi:AprI/Inh family metalloprotease inhibitor [Labrenzia sp. CE80]|uniref:AprI/Inh family metalloprotease inhibitor n=1 Tax=Labrenzia sp. CE80 TaxID=1788986 RepID=UPI00129A94A0|nr:AprI/Inh family metalloprotease inhibitor [Labrenzia sp. CE80]